MIGYSKINFAKKATKKLLFAAKQVIKENFCDRFKI